jgi:hypothetical protein
MTVEEKLDVAERRARYFFATAVLAARGELSEDQVAMAGAVCIWNAPPLSEIEKLEDCVKSRLRPA